MLCVLLALGTLAARTDAQEGARGLELAEGDCVVVLGNTFAERMGLFGYLETFLHCRFPDHRLVLRNLGWSADEVGLRPRPLGFPDLTEDLDGLGADVLLLCFGANESFGGEAAMPLFEEQLDALAGQLEVPGAEGAATRRLVFVSPIASEDTPADSPRNEALARATEVMRTVAERRGALFADLFTPTRGSSREDPGRRLTINGIHVSARGDWHTSALLARELGLLAELPDLEAADAEPAPGVEDLRRAVLDKNDTFALWWRGPNMEYVHGRRNRLRGAVGMPAEREQLRAIVAQQELALWELEKPTPEDVWRHEPPAVPLWIQPPSYQGIVVPPVEGDPDAEGEDESWEPLLTPAEALELFELPEGYRVGLFASEESAPLANPMAMCFDTQGRLWVANTPTWPHPLPGVPPDDSLVVLEDTDGDGVADEHTVFLDGLDMIHGFALGDGGVYISQTPNLIHARDVDGDLRADRFEVVLHGFGGEDVEHSINNHEWGPDGALYFMEGIFFHTQVETPAGPRRLVDGGVFRYEPRSGRFDVELSYAFWNPWGLVFDGWGRGIVLDASSHDYFATSVLSSRFVYPKEKHNQHDRLSFAPGDLGPGAGLSLLESRHFPDQVQGRLLANQLSAGFRGTLWSALREDGTSWRAERQEPDLLASRDPSFRPTALGFGPDGALFVLDFSTPMIENTSDRKRAEGRDHSHGRVWRVFCEERPLLEPPRIAGRPAPELLDLLAASESLTREHARWELRERGAAEVLPHLAGWIEGLDAEDPAHERRLLDALWVQQAQRAVDGALLRRLLGAEDARVRTAATRALRQELHALAGVLELLETLVEDADPRVRLEAVLACGYEGSARARDLALRVTRHPMDTGMRHALDETLDYFERAGAGDR